MSGIWICIKEVHTWQNDSDLSGLNKFPVWWARMLRKLALEYCCLSESCCQAIGQNIELEVLHLAMCSVSISTVGLKLTVR